MILNTSNQANTTMSISKILHTKMSDLSESEKEIRRKYFQEYYSRNKDTILTQQRQRRKNLKVDKEQQSSSSSSSPSSSSTDEEKPINLCEDQIQALIEIETFLS